MGEIFEGSLEAQSMELMMRIHENDQQFKARLASLRAALEKIDASFRKRLITISDNADRYEPGKVADMEYNLRVSVRKEIEELVRARGFASEIDACVAELKEQEPKNDIQQMTQTLKEIEVRRLMFASGDDFQMQFLGAISDGDPLIVQAIENSPVALPIDIGMLEDAQEKMRAVLKPAMYQKYQSLLRAQSTIESMSNSVMPINSDPIAEISASIG